MPQPPPRRRLEGVERTPSGRVSRAKPSHMQRTPGRKPLIPSDAAGLKTFRRLLHDWQQSGLSMEDVFQHGEGGIVPPELRMTPAAVYKTANRLGVSHELPYSRARLTPEFKSQVITNQRRTMIPIDVVAWRYDLKPSTIKTWGRQLRRPVLGNTKHGRRDWWRRVFPDDPDFDICEVDLEQLLENHNVPLHLAVEAFHDLHPQEETTKWSIPETMVDIGLEPDEVEELRNEIPRVADAEHANIIVVPPDAPPIYFHLEVDEEILDG